MSKQTAENYLDELLDSVNKTEKSREATSVDREFLKELQMAKVGDEAWKYGAYRSKLTSPDGLTPTARAEAQFLLDFERELVEDDYSEYFDIFEENEILPEDRLGDEDVRIAGTEGKNKGSQGEKTSSQEIPEEKPLEEVVLDNTTLEKLFSGEEGAKEPDLSADYDVAPADAIDLSQMGEEDLINLLAGTEDLADIGALLASNDSETPIDGTDPFAAFAAGEMAAQENGPETETEKKGTAKEPKKGGFLEKLKDLLFGKEEEEPVKEQVVLTTGDAFGIEELSDENAQILATFAEADKTEAEDKAAIKDKKQKKKKNAKEKKPAKPKAPKSVKPKKPKVVDNTPPLPKGPVVLVFLLAISILVFVYFGTTLIGYSSAISKANKLYKLGQYTEAAAQLNGLEIKDKDVMFHGKVSTLAAVDSEISAYQIFMKNDRKAEALDCLISAAGRCEVNDNNTLLFDCAGEMGILKDGIKVELQEQFGLTYEEAIELYELTERNRDSYTIALHELMDELGIEWE